MHFADAFRRRPSAARWVNVPFIAYSAFGLLMGSVEGVKAIWPWLILLPLFTIQLARPTVAGWFLTILAWGLLWVLVVSSTGVPDLSTNLLYFALPLALLALFRPKLRAGANPTQP